MTKKDYVAIAPNPPTTHKGQTMTQEFIASTDERAKWLDMAREALRQAEVYRQMGERRLMREQYAAADFYAERAERCAGSVREALGRP